MIKFNVRNRFSGEVQFVSEIECAEDVSPSIKLGLAVKWAFKARANLTRANLTDANLTRANLTRANLTDAYLTGANLTDANLTGANLTRANLTDANLTRANLTRANLTDAYLTGADLTGADLTGAYLTGADLTDANLTGADLTRANLIDGGQRSDGYRFVGWIKDGALQIRAGCRSFDIAAAREHWLRTRAGTPLGAETMAILNHIEVVASIRGLIKPQAEAAE